MNFLKDIFGTKESTETMVAKADAVAAASVQQGKADAWQKAQMLEQIQSCFNPFVCGDNFMEMYRDVPEVFWPIDYIAKRISEGHYDLKRVKDDSIVWCNRQDADLILKQPNPLMSWREIVYQHFVFKFVTGNAFLRAAMAESITPDATIFTYCSNYWELPANKVKVEPAGTDNIPLFGIGQVEDLVKGYNLRWGPYSTLTIPQHQVWHDRDGLPECLSGIGFMKAASRLMSVKKAISNLIVVYAARNIIYLKRGALGFIVANKQDQTGTVALTPKEKADLQDTMDNTYGLTDGKSPFGLTDVPISFVRTNLSIAELQPFDETLEDAIKIASIFGIPAVLVPRKDQSTFSNQDTAEKSVYTSTIIPAAKRFCEELTQFLGLERKGLYIDCDFSDVACLQVGLKEAEQVKKLLNDRCLMQFNNSVITFNDWRAQAHESALDGDLYNKVKLEMTPGELEKINSIIKSQTLTPSKGEEDERTDDQPSVRDQGAGGI